MCVGYEIMKVFIWGCYKLLSVMEKHYIRVFLLFVFQNIDNNVYNFFIIEKIFLTNENYANKIPLGCCTTVVCVYFPPYLSAFSGIRCSLLVRSFNPSKESASADFFYAKCKR